MRFRRSRRQSIPFLLGAGLLVLILPLLASCGGDDDDTGSGGGAGATLCADGEHRYYCVTTTITEAKAIESTEVIDICDDDEGFGGDDCDLEIDGSNVSAQCSFTDDLGGDCTVDVEIDLSGTLTDQMIDITGTVTTTSTDPDCSDDVLGTLNYSVVGDRVDAADSECGDGGGEPGEEGTIQMTVTKPSGDVDLNGFMVGSEITGGYEIGTVTMVDGITYTLSFTVPEITEELPQTFPLSAALKIDGALVSYLEFAIEPPAFWTLTEVTSGNLTITNVTETGIAGSFDLTGTVAENGGQESRTLVGEFNASLSGEAKAAAVEPASRGEVLRRALLQRLVEGMLVEAWDVERSLVGP
jgi:hypothetical protein